MKDFTNWSPNEERVTLIRDGFAKGENEAQVAFRDLISYVYDELEAHRDGDKQAPRGLMAAMKNGLIIAGFGEKGTLAKSYLNPAFTFASTLHGGKASPVILAIWDDFLVTGEEHEGAQTKGPLYTPGRLNAGWGRLVRTEDTPFRADMDGIIAVDKEGNERHWATLSIAEIKALNQRGDVNPKVGASLMRVLGNPENLEKRPGELAKVVAKLRTDNEHLKSEVIADFCDNLDGVISDLRGDMAVTLAECEVEAAEARKLEAEQARLDRAKDRGTSNIEEQDQRGGEVLSREPDPSEADEAEVEEETVES